MRHAKDLQTKDKVIRPSLQGKPVIFGLHVSCKDLIKKVYSNNYDTWVSVELIDYQDCSKGLESWENLQECYS